MSQLEIMIYFLAAVFFVWSSISASLYVLIGFLSHKKWLPKPTFTICDYKIRVGLEDWQFLAFWWPVIPIATPFVLLNLLYLSGKSLTAELRKLFHHSFYRLGVWLGKKVSK